MPKNKRNGRTREQNLIKARWVRDFNQEEKKTNWRDKSGRKSKQVQVQKLLLDYPNKNLSELEKISGMTRKTIRKWKNFDSKNT